MMVGYRQEIQQVGTGESVRGMLYLYDRSCYFAVPSMLYRSGQYIVTLQFSISTLQVKKEQLRGNRSLLFTIPSNENEVVIEEFVIMYVDWIGLEWSGLDWIGLDGVIASFDSSTDLRACEHIIQLNQRQKQENRGKVGFYLSFLKLNAKYISISLFGDSFFL